VEGLTAPGRNRRDVAERLHETLTGAGAPLLGVVANGFKQGRRGSYGSYGYAYNYATTGSGPTAGPGAPAGAGTEGSVNGAVSSDAPVPTSQA
jgi:Mrp family chromosome partitioning ATPase